MKLSFKSIIFLTLLFCLALPAYAQKKGEKNSPPAPTPPAAPEEGGPSTEETAPLPTATHTTAITLGAAAEFKTTSALPEALRGHTLVHSGKKLYALGGLGTSGLNTLGKVYSAEITQPGMLGAWQDAGELPDSVFFHASAISNNIIYVLGGHHYNTQDPRRRFPAPSDVVYYSTLPTDATPGEWKTTTPLPEKLVNHMAVISGGRIYVSGGWSNGILSNRIYSAPIAKDGSIGQWNAVASLPENLHSHAAVEDGTLYLLGGIAGGTEIQSTVYQGQILADGSLTSWNETTPLPQPLSHHDAAVLHGRIYVSGGLSSSAISDSVYSAAIQSDKSLGSWDVVASLPTPLYQHASAATENALYVAGGMNTTGFSANVYSLTFETKKITATADLHPKTLNLLSKGMFTTLYLEFPAFAGQAADIDAATIRIADINGTAANLAALPKPTGLGDGNENGIIDLMVKFDRASLSALLGNGDNKISFTGSLKDGSAFSAQDTIWAKTPVKKRGEKIAVTLPSLSLDGNSALGVIGKKGGHIHSTSKAGVRIPENAASGVHISVAPAEHGDTPEKTRRDFARKQKMLAAAGPAIEYGPEGTQFEQSVTLEIPYDPALLAEDTKEEELLIHYWNPKSGEWEALASTVDQANRIVRAQTNHFSLYQVLSGGTSPAASEDSDFRFREVYAFPNPARGDKIPTLHVEAESAERIDIHIYDLSGERVYSTTVNGPAPAVDDGSGRGPVAAFEHRWDTSGVGSGVYIYAVTAHISGRTSIRTRGKVAVVK